MGGIRYSRVVENEVAQGGVAMTTVDGAHLGAHLIVGFGVRGIRA